MTLWGGGAGSCNCHTYHLCESWSSTRSKKNEFLILPSSAFVYGAMV